jgi:hypothetical protein
VLVWLLQGLAMPAEAQQDLRAFEVERIARDEEIPCGALLEVLNPHGDIRMRASQDGMLRVLAVVQRVGDLEQPVSVEVQRLGLLVRATVLAPDRLRERMGRDALPPVLNRVDLTLLVPPGRDVAAATRDGRIEIKGISGDAVAITQTGEVFVRSPGTVTAHSDSGIVQIWLTGAAWSRPARLTSRSGPLRLGLRADPDVTVVGSTGGPEPVGPWKHMGTLPDGRRSYLMTLGSGGAPVLLHSETGTLEVESLGKPSPAPAAGGRGHEILGTRSDS